jgi:hypothetical protein
MLNVLMTEMRLQSSRIVDLVGQCIAAGVSQHVWMRLEAKPNPARPPTRSTILANPAVVNGVPRSEVNTKGDFGF